MVRSAVVIGYLLLLGFTSCNKNDVYANKSKTIDSLSGALNSLAANIAKTDTAVLKRSVAKYLYYKQFISLNVDDTLKREEADQLQHFFAAGAKLEAFILNRKAILQRVEMQNAQLEKLSQDIRERSLEPSALEIYSRSEQDEAAKILSAGAAQQQIFHTSLEEFRNALRGAENIIRSRNNGELPVIIKDTVEL